MRQSGILMHITSLPGPYGVGTLGRYAYRFVDFLKAAGQSYWQLLPLNPTGYGDSPYQSTSPCAGNPYLIDLDILVEEGLLEPSEIQSVNWGEDPGRVNFGILYAQRLSVLRKAFARFTPTESYHRFCQENAFWLPEYCLFMSLKSKFGGASWLQWPEELKLRQADALESAKQELSGEIELHRFLQYKFFQQWNALRSYAGKQGIAIIGDVPIYVPMDSVDVWANPQLFCLDENRQPQVVAGCPPDAFTADGQLWGNPIYDWEAMKQTQYSWWLQRLGAAAKLYDVIRLDHFRGFESYWAVPAGDLTARNGQWVKGPGMDFIQVIQERMPELRFIAEDLGYVTSEVRALLDASGYPGMKVIQFAFDSREESNYLPHLYPVHSVCYSGTHDNVTLKQWLEDASAEDVAYAKAYLGLNAEEGYVWGMLRGCMSSVSQLFIAQMQDYLELGADARMNFPGTLSISNWTWRAQEGFDSPALAVRIREATRLYGRLGQQS